MHVIVTGDAILTTPNVAPETVELIREQIEKALVDAIKGIDASTVFRIVNGEDPKFDVLVKNRTA